MKMRRRSIRDMLESPSINEYYILITRSYPRILIRQGLLTIQQANIHAWERQLAYTSKIDKQGIRDLMAHHKCQAGDREIILLCYGDNDDNCHAKDIMALISDQ